MSVGQIRDGGKGGQSLGLGDSRNWGQRVRRKRLKTEHLAQHEEGNRHPLRRAAVAEPEDTAAILWGEWGRGRWAQSVANFHLVAKRTKEHDSKD